MKLHFFVDCLHIFIFEKNSSSWVVALEGGHIENVVIKDDKSLFCLLRVGLDFFKVFEFQIKRAHLFNFYL